MAWIGVCVFFLLKSSYVKSVCARLIFVSKLNNLASCCWFILSAEWMFPLPLWFGYTLWPLWLPLGVRAAPRNPFPWKQTQMASQHGWFHSRWGSIANKHTNRERSVHLVALSEVGTRASTSAMGIPTLHSCTICKFALKVWGKS